MTIINEAPDSEHDIDKATCDVCGDVPSRRCFECPNGHRSCDECSCEEWQQLCEVLLRLLFVVLLE